MALLHNLFPSKKMFNIERERHFARIREIEKGCRKIDRFSHTTQRFRDGLVHFLLDNPPRGPIVEVGTLHGGMTAILAYVAGETGRVVHAVDMEPHRVEETRDTCERFGLADKVISYCGVYERFLQEVETGRPDLVFIDSDHSYNVTIAELRAIAPNPPRALALHDFNYRQHKQKALFDDLTGANPIAVDFALRDFLAEAKTQPVMIRLGAHANDGTVTTIDNQGGHTDYVAPFGTEGMLLIWP
jgi:predicted O-methyltransferase YrrM